MKNQKTPMPKSAKSAKWGNIQNLGDNMKSANEFYITEGKKQTGMPFHKGGVKKERLPSGEWISRFRVESPENVFRFAIRGDVSFQSRDVLEIAPRFVRFRDGARFDYPVYQLCKTEELPADERTARLLAADRAERKDSEAIGNMTLDGLEGLRAACKRIANSKGAKGWDVVAKLYGKKIPDSLLKLPVSEVLDVVKRNFELGANTEKQVDLIEERIKQANKNPNRAGPKRVYDTKADDKMFKRWNEWRAALGNGRRGRKAFIAEEKIDMTDKQLEALINRTQKRHNQ